MSPNVLTEYPASPVVGIEMHVEGINVASAMIVDNDSAANGSLSFAVGVRLHTLEPCWIGSHVCDRGKIHIRPVISVQLVEIIQSECVWYRDVYKVDLWFGIGKLGAYITWKVCIFGVKPDNRCYSASGYLCSSERSQIDLPYFVTNSGTAADWRSNNNAGAERTSWA